MNFTFRPALASEHDTVDRVLRAAFTPYMHRLGRGIPTDYYSKWLMPAIEGGDVFVAAAADGIAGVAATQRRAMSLYVDRLAVDPARQAKGLGSWLLDRLEEVARARGDKTMSLETAEMMDHLIRLYRRNGFEIASRGPAAHGLDPHIRVHMVKPL
jgi:GNAT superfamily N-acetyltransferase